MKLEETSASSAKPTNVRAKRTTTPKEQFLDILVKQWRLMLQCVGLVLIFNVTDYMALSYLTATLKFNETHGLFIVLIVMVLMMRCP